VSYRQSFRFEAIDRSLSSIDRPARAFYRSPNCFSAFQLPGSYNFTNRHRSFIIGLFCWQTLKQNKCVTVHGPCMVSFDLCYTFLFTGSATVASTLLYFDAVWLAVGLLMLVKKNYLHSSFGGQVWYLGLR